MRCKTLNCENEGGARSGYCPNCQHGFYYWGKRSPARLLARRQNLLVYKARIDVVARKRGIDDKG